MTPMPTPHLAEVTFQHGDAPFILHVRSFAFAGSQINVCGGAGDTGLHF